MRISPPIFANCILSHAPLINANGCRANMQLWSRLCAFLPRLHRRQIIPDFSAIVVAYAHSCSSAFLSPVFHRVLSHIPAASANGRVTGISPSLGNAVGPLESIPMIDAAATQRRLGTTFGLWEMRKGFPHRPGLVASRRAMRKPLSFPHLP